MANKEIIKEFEDLGAILKGHFVLSSGLHSDTYIQCAKVMENPALATKLCGELKKKIEKELGEFTVVISPAMGGILVGYEIARQFGVKTIFCERVNGKFELRRGFELNKGDKVLIIEDVITTGKSSIEVIDCISNYEVDIVGEAALIYRGDGVDLGIDFTALLEVKVETFDDNNVPDYLKEIEITKPGSRFIK